MSFLYGTISSNFPNNFSSYLQNPLTTSTIPFSQTMGNANNTSFITDKISSIRHTIHLNFGVIIILIAFCFVKYISSIVSLVKRGLKSPYMYSFFMFITTLIKIAKMIYKKNKSAMTMLEDIQSHNYNTPSSLVKSSDQHNKTVWTDISKLCDTNIETIFNSIINDFQNDEINKIFDDPLPNISIMTKEEESKLIEEFETINKLNMESWRKTNISIKTKFVEKYKEFKLIEQKLLDIKDNIKGLKDWKNNTSDLFQNLGDEYKESNMKKSVDEFIKDKVSKMDCDESLQRYKQLYCDLKVMLKFLNNNPETHVISTCPICVTNLKDSFIVPCGHCACKNCFDEQMKIDKVLICPICRANGTKIGKLFY